MPYGKLFYNMDMRGRQVVQRKTAEEPTRENQEIGILSAGVSGCQRDWKASGHALVGLFDRR